MDLGATGKALAADMAAAAAASATGCGVLVSLCGDVAVAGDPPPDGWQIRVTDDHRHGNAPGQTVTISDGGLATSSVTVRPAGDGVTHHLIDPTTGLPTAGTVAHGHRRRRFVCRSQHCEHRGDRARRFGARLARGARNCRAG